MKVIGGFIKIKNAFKEDDSLRKTLVVFLFIIVMYLMGYYILIMPGVIGLILGYMFWDWIGNKIKRKNIFKKKIGVD